MVAIKLTEERAMTLRQLRQVWARVEAEFKGWKDWKGEPLQLLLAINLYHINDNLIRPMVHRPAQMFTSPPWCSFCLLVLCHCHRLDLIAHLLH